MEPRSWKTGSCLVTLVILALAAAPARAGEPARDQPPPTVLAAAPAPATPTSQPGEPALAPPPDQGQAPYRDWFDRTKNPVTWLKWGADLRLRWEYYNNAFTGFNQDTPGHERSYYRQRTRLWSTVMPCPDLEINTRLAWEFKSYAQPEIFNPGTNRGFRDTDLDEVIFDTLNVKWKNILGQPLDVTVGRQDIILGDGWLVLDGTPLDGSRSIFFDAVRATYKLKPIQTTADLIYINQHADSDWWIEPFNHREYMLSNQDEQGAILYLSNKSLKKTQLDGYFIYKKDEFASGIGSTNPILKPLKAGEEGEIYTLGARAVHTFDSHWEAKGELATQFGHKNGRELEAFGGTGRMTYYVRDPLDNQFRFVYEYLSGDDPSTRHTNEGWDPLWGRWPQWSEVYAVLSALDTGRPAFYTNHHRLGPGWTFKPCGKSGPLEFNLDYNLLFRDEEEVNPAKGPANFDNGCFRGQYVAAILKYKFNEHVSSHLWGEAFFPGNFYSDFRNDVATFLRWELMFTW